MDPKWPSLEEQLRAANVTAGSALEQLIKDNQEFHLLRPEEASDNADLPPWLRVYWRKNHRDVEHSTVNPGAGYPDVLYTIYALMLTHHDLPWDAEANSKRVPMSETPPSEQETGHKSNRGINTSDLRISGTATNPRSESDIRLNYDDPKKIVIDYRLTRG